MFLNAYYSKNYASIMCQGLLANASTYLFAMVV